jgi:long-chain acyl-CoA synthetase
MTTIDDDLTLAPGAEPPALGASTMAQVFLRSIARRGNAVALRTSDGVTEIRYDELPELLRAVAAARAAHGVARADSVGLMLTNRTEFHVIDGAAMLLGATPFSVYNTAPPEQPAFVIGDAGARIVIGVPRRGRRLRPRGRRTRTSPTAGSRITAL